MQEIKKLGNMANSNQRMALYDKTGIAPCFTTCSGGELTPYIYEVTRIDEIKELEQSIVAMRGRDPQNPSDRTAGNPNLEQRLEPNSEGICNTITTVQKDNLVMEKEIINPAKGLSDYGWHFEQNLYTEDSLCRSIKASEGSGNIPKTIEVKQATKDGYIPCEVGGGVRSELPRQCYTQGQSSGKRTDLSNADNGEYP